MLPYKQHLPSQPNQSVIGALACLEAVVASSQPVGGRELARELHIDRVRVNRLLMTLAQCGVLERNSIGRYKPGPGIHALAALASEGSSLQRMAIPHVRPWWQEGFAVTVGILWRQYICYVVRARPETPLEEALGSRHGPVLESSAGLMLLASLSSQRLADLNIESATPLHAETLPLKKLLARTRRDGYARLHFADGTISLGCPIGKPAIAALAVARKGIDNQISSEILTRLRLTAQAIACDVATPR